MESLALIIISFVLFISLMIGLAARRGKDMNLEEWSVGNRSLGTLFTFLLMAGELYTSFTFLGGCSAAYSMGMPAMYTIVAAPSFVTIYWLGPLIWREGKKRRFISQSDFFSDMYKSKAFGIVCAAVGLIAMIPYICAQLQGLGVIVSEASYGRISYAVAIWIGLIIVTVYIMVSGLKGSAWTSALKDILALVAVIFLAIYLPVHYYGGITPMFKAINEAHPTSLLFPSTGLSITWFITIGIEWGIGKLCWPQMWPAILSSKTVGAVKKNAIISPIYMLVLVFVLFIGFSAVLEIPGLEGSDVNLVLFKMAEQTFSPWVVGLIGAAGALCAIVPASVLLLAASTLVSKNIVHVMKPDMTDDQIGKVGKLMVPVIALIAVLATFNGGTTIVFLVNKAYNVVVQLLPALLFGFVRKEDKSILSVPAATCGMIAGILFVAYAYFQNMTNLTGFTFLPSFLQDMDAGMFALIINAIVAFVVNLFTRGNRQRGALVRN